MNLMVLSAGNGAGRCNLVDLIGYEKEFKILQT